MFPLCDIEAVQGTYLLVQATNELTKIYLIFHVPMFKRCIGSLVSILPIDVLGVNKNISYEEVLFEILDLQDNKLRKK